MDYLQCAFYGFLAIIGFAFLMIILYEAYQKFTRFFEIVWDALVALLFVGGFFSICYLIGLVICGKQ